MKDLKSVYQSVIFHLTSCLDVPESSVTPELVSDCMDALSGDAVFTFSEIDDVLSEICEGHDVY